jgi:hypothetical protein
MVWKPSNQLMAQLLHTSVGALFTLGAVAIGRKWYEGAGTIIALDLVKELTFDQAVEKVSLCRKDLSTGVSTALVFGLP